MKKPIIAIPESDFRFTDGSRDPGRKSIMVDGRKWGEIHMERKGQNGTCYFFYQDGVPGKISEMVREEGIRPWRRVLCIWSQQGPNEKPAPLETRLIEAARKLVRTKRLRDPDIVHAEKAAAQKARDAERDAEKAAEEKLWREKVREALTGNKSGKALEDAIIDAMRWAQSR